MVMFRDIDLKTASQYDLAKALGLSPVLVSFEENISEEQQLISELFAFAENYELSELLDKLELIYP